MSSFITRVLLVAVSILALTQAVAAFMCYTKTMGKDDGSTTFCSSGTCYSMGGSFGDDKDATKGCAEEPHEDGCVEGGFPGFVSAHVCYCSSVLCNSAYTTTAVVPMLLLPLLLQRLL